MFRAETFIIDAAHMQVKPDALAETLPVALNLVGQSPLFTSSSPRRFGLLPTVPNQYLYAHASFTYSEIMEFSTEEAYVTLPILKRHVGRVPLKGGIIVGVTAIYLLVQLLTRWVSTRQRHKKLGQKAPSVSYYAPFGVTSIIVAFQNVFLVLILGSGIDLFATAIIRLLKHDFFGWSRELLSVPGRTISLNMLGVEVIATDDLENLRAVISTKVSTETVSIDFQLMIPWLSFPTGEEVTLSARYGMI